VIEGYMKRFRSPVEARGCPEVDPHPGDPIFGDGHRADCTTSISLVKRTSGPTEPGDSASRFALAEAGEIEIGGRCYLTAERLSNMLGVTVRTLARWNASRIGPPKIKIGKTVLFDLAKLPEWLAAREIPATRNSPNR
jgi:hypothetical protein